MIECNENNVAALLATLARTLSPTLKYRRNDIARHWIFEESNWIAEEVFEEDPKRFSGIKLASSDFNKLETTTIEIVLGALTGYASKFDECAIVDEQFWGEEYPFKQFDCGYERQYKISKDTLRITINHKGSNRGKKTTAIAALRKEGKVTWQILCELKGPRIRSRHEQQYRVDDAKGYGSPNAGLFHADEKELFYMAMRILES